MVAIGGHRQSFVTISTIYTNGSMAIVHHWYRSVQTATNVGRRWEKSERTQYVFVSGVTPAAPHQWHPPPTAQHNYPGAIIYPMTSNIPGQSGGRATGPQPYAAPLQCPTAAGQIPGPSAAAGPMDSPVSDKRTCDSFIRYLPNFQNLIYVLIDLFRGPFELTSRSNEQILTLTILLEWYLANQSGRGSYYQVKKNLFKNKCFLWHFENTKTPT